MTKCKNCNLECSRLERKNKKSEIYNLSKYCCVCGLNWIQSNRFLFCTKCRKSAIQRGYLELNKMYQPGNIKRKKENKDSPYTERDTFQWQYFLVEHNTIICKCIVGEMHNCHLFHGCFDQKELKNKLHKI